MNLPKDKLTLENVTIKPYVGQHFYVVEINNAARYNGGEQFYGIVTKVGKKYFTVTWKIEYEFLGEQRTYTNSEQFHIDSLEQKTDCSPSLKLYSSEKEEEDEKLTNEIYALLRNEFNYGYNKNNHSLETLKSVAELLKLEME